MKMLRRTRLAVAALALGGLGLGSVAQADPFVGRLIGSVAAGMLVNGAIKKHDKKFAAQCRLYDREGAEVYLPCDSRRPLGEVMLAERPAAMADGLAGGPPAAVEVAPLAAPAAPPPMDHYAPPPGRHHAPAEADCGCEYDQRGAPVHAARPHDTYLSAREGHARATYGSGRAVGVYEAYEDFSESGAARYSESYSRDGGYGFSGGWEGSGGYYPYGGVGYGAGGYGYDRARVAGRDRDGFLTWAGKPVR